MTGSIKRSTVVFWFMPATRRRACSVRAIEAGSLSGDGLGDEVNIGRAFEAGSLSLRAYYTHVAGLVPFVPTTCM